MLQTLDEPLTMTLYVKTGSATLQTIHLSGQSVASLMQVEYVQKVVQNYQQSSSFSLQDYLVYESVGNFSYSCESIKERYKQQNQVMKVKINDQEVVLDTQAKMLRHLNCMSDEDQQKDVYDRLFK